MDESIERLFCVYRVPEAGRALISCPYDQRPLFATIVHKGSLQSCERFIRETAMLVQAAVRQRRA